jgi:hypothetical protein
MHDEGSEAALRLLGTGLRRYECQPGREQRGGRQEGGKKMGMWLAHGGQ